MTVIIDKEYLKAVNEIADSSLGILNDLQSVDPGQEIVAVNKDTLLKLTSGYLYLYNKTLEYGIVPKSQKHFNNNIH